MTLIRFFLMSLAACILAATATQASRAGDIETLAQRFGQDRDLMFPALSPDGARVAFVTSADGRRLLVVMSLEGDAAPRSMDVSGRKIRSLYWADDRFVMTMISDFSSNVQIGGAGRNVFERYLNEEEFFALYALDTRSMSTVQMLGREPSMLPQTHMARVAGYRDGRVLMPAYRLGARGRVEETVFAVDPASGTGRVVETLNRRSADWSINTWQADADGRLFARLDYNWATGASTLELNTGSGWSAHPDWTGRVLWNGPSGVDPDGSGVYAIQIIDGYERLMRFPADGASMQVVLSAPPGRDLYSVLHDPRTRAPVGGVYLGGASRQFFLDPALAALHDMVAARAPGLNIEMESWNAARTRALVRIASPGEPGMVVLADAESGEVAALGEIGPSLTHGGHVGVRRMITYTARDGAQLEAVITDPPGAGPDDRLPLAAMPHGGPASHDNTDFDYIAGFVAALGYRVVQPNFRGSSGYGRAFEEAGWREWGGRMQDDVTDAVAYLVNAGAVDPERICIAGGSYGGYAALAGATFTPDLYRCAAAVAPVTDLVAFSTELGVQSSRRSARRDYWRRTIGDPTRQRDVLMARSPARHAAQVRVPILLIHPEQDTVVTIRQSELMARALTDAGKDVRFVRLAGEDHWLSLPETRIAMLRELGAFLTTHLGAP